jgi:hypothetical protein
MNISQNQLNIVQFLNMGDREIRQKQLKINDLARLVNTARYNARTSVRGL